MEKAIAIITARGGSKRIPRKNIKEFCGKPIIAYSIEAAKKSGRFSEIMVSTDSEEIAEISRNYGANVPFLRSKKTSDDYATTADVLMEVLDGYKQRKREFEYTCCIYPTAPFVTEDKLIRAMEIMERKNPVAVMPVVQFSYPPQRCYVVDEYERIHFKFPQYATARSQDLEKQYHDAGQFYVYQTKDYLKKKGMVWENIMPIIVSELEVQDIDNETDWELAEIKYKIMCEKNKGIL